MESRRGGWRPSRNEDFQETDVWDIMTKMEEAIARDCEQPYEGLLSRRLQSAARRIPKPRSLSTPDQPRLAQQSAPVDIPDWSKDALFSEQRWCDDGRDSTTRNRFMGHAPNDDVDDWDDQTRWLPPHLWLARKHTRNHISSFSVCEGVGRTLKGRDLTRVRDAVLTQTGFIG